MESALARPQNAFAYGEEDLVVLAVRLMAGIAQSSCLRTGQQKDRLRLAAVSPRSFLLASGFDLAIQDTEAWADRVIALIEHQLTEEEFTELLRPFVAPRD